MDIDYVLFNPTGNITVLVTSPVKIEDQPAIATDLLKLETMAEQVGFVSPGDDECDIRLRMAGGEFCGNATLSAAALYSYKKKLFSKEPFVVKVKVSGISKVFLIVMSYNGNDYTGTIEMPKPLSISEKTFHYEGGYYKYPVVSFAGISHVIIEDDMPIMMTERAIKLWCDELKEKCLGFMIFNKEKSSLRPLVYVNYPETLYWESSCASGTTAVGVYEAYKAKAPVSMAIKEPGGILQIETDSTGALYLTGHTTLLTNHFN